MNMKLKTPKNEEDYYRKTHYRKEYYTKSFLE